MTGSRRGIPRRAFVKSAVAIGGASALAACIAREEMPDLPTGPDDLSALPLEQHAWDEFLSQDDHGNVVAPRHHVILLLNYANEGVPTEEDRSTVETALESFERAYQRSNEGAMATIGFSPRYFDRFDESLPDSVDLPEPEPLAPFEDPEFDRSDAVVHFASDYGQVVLAAEQALMGEQDELNGVTMDASFADVFEPVDRRTGFVGEGMPAENQNVRGIPDSEPVDEESPLFMGFKSGFQKNQASEDRVTIEEGPFAGGTTQHVSRLRLNLDQWYEQDSRFQREAKMFCPVHADEGRIEGTGENLGTESGIDDCIDTIDDDARSYGMVGHSQKSAQAREDDSPIIIRRDFNSTDDGEAGLHFVAVQRTISDFVDTREAMNGTDVANNSAVGQRTNNGILQYFSVKRRGNYLLPPRDKRALPTPNPA